MRVGGLITCEAHHKLQRMSKVRRTRTGCLCCRRRHKKCDEAKPSCKFCESKGITCEWPVKGAVFVNYKAEQGPLVFDSVVSSSTQGPQGPQGPFPSTGPAIGAMMSSFYINTEYHPSSKASSTASEESLDRSPKTPQSTLQMFTQSTKEPPQEPDLSFSYAAPISPKSTAHRYDLPTTTPLSLPPLKAYHFTPRMTSVPSTPLTIAPKRLSVDSLLN